MSAKAGAVDAHLDGDVLQAGPGVPFAAKDLRGALEDYLPSLAGDVAVGVAVSMASALVITVLRSAWARG